MLKTRITELFGIRYPIISAPMGGHSGGRLAAAVSQAGALGTFGAVPADPDWVGEQIRYVRSQTDKPFGVGFITPFLPNFPKNFEVALEEKVPVILLSFSDPAEQVARAKQAGLRTICQVQRVEDAREALAAGTDVLVVQGNEAGGHTGLISTLTFLSLIFDIAGNTPVAAAGGIGNGRALAAVLAAGGEGAWIGTPFLATPEAIEVSDAYKERIVGSDGQDTIYTRVFDIIEGAPWPPHIPGRALKNRFAQEWHGREDDLQSRRDELAPAYLNAKEKKDTNTAPVWMGQSAGSVKAVRPASEVVQSICDEAERILRQRTSALLT